MSHLNIRVVGHREKIQSLYKRAYRLLQGYIITNRETFLYKATLLRHDFDKNKNELDAIKCLQLIEDAERELSQRADPIPLKFPDSPGGVAYNRGGMPPPDYVLDYWHPLEKAMYPKYFATREVRKKEYIEWWHRTYDSPADKQKSDSAHS